MVVFDFYSLAVSFWRFEFFLFDGFLTGDSINVIIVVVLFLLAFWLVVLVSLVLCCGDLVWVHIEVQLRTTIF